MKLNILLAKVESSTPVFKKLITEYIGFFSKKQDEFQGVKKTYSPREGTKDEPSMRQNKKVVTTVAEKLQYLEETTSEHLNNVMSVEATNASGTVKVELIVDGISFGKLSSLELMKLKSILEKEQLEAMYSVMPVRSDAEVWDPSSNEEHVGRDIWETPRQDGVNKSIDKEECILEDPNILKMIQSGGIDVSKYNPVKSVRNKVLDLGDYTLQKFSGETTHRYRAGVLARRSRFLQAVNAALKEANDAQIVKSEFTAKTLFDYLHGNI